MRQIPLAIGPDAPPTFDEYAPGPNAEALEHLRALGPEAAPVYLWGPSGCGKSHLLEALARRFDAEGRCSAAYGPAEPAPWPIDDTVSLLLIDGCDALDPGQQQAAFTLFVEAATAGVPIVAAGRLPPVDLPLREDLRSRLGWGHVYAIRPLDDASARHILRRLAERRGIVLADEVIDYLLTRFARDLKHLVDQLDRLDRYSLANQRPITVPLLRRMLAEEGG